MLILFYDTEVKVLTSPDPASYIKTEYGDVQPFSKSVSFEDGFIIDITKRIFCDAGSFINIDSYVIISNEIYKVMEIKKWDSYIEAYLYKCKRQIGL